MKNTVVPVQRRSFMGTLLAAGAAPLVVPRRLLGEGSPASLLRIGCIGTGRMGFANMNNALGAGDATQSRIVAVCDVDLNRAREARELVEKRRKEDFGEEAEVAVYQDYRQMIDRGGLDGVIISTPDFQHALMAIDCARAGLGMYVEKPLTYTVREGQALVKAVRQNKVVVQTGSQQRSQERFHRVCWLVRNGRIGKLKEVEVRLPPDRGQAAFTPSAVPPHLDYDRWLGPAPFTPYSESRVHSQQGRNIRPGFLQIEQYCLGMITGWGAHMFDIARWGIGPEAEAGPIEISAKGEFPDRGVYDVHTNFTGEARLANGIVIRSSTGEHVTRFVGEDGWLSVNREKFEASDPEILRERPAGGIGLATSKNHMRNFLECLRSGADPVAPVEEGHRTNNLCVAHWMAMKLGGRKIVWDPVREEAVGDPEASRMLHYAYRDGYALPS